MSDVNLMADNQSECSHTPGPWIAYPEGIKVGDKPVANRMAIQAMDEDGPVGHIAFSEANARLIAAAPELLEACKAALLQMCLTNSPCNAFTDAVDALDAAIAKAEGKS